MRQLCGRTGVLCGGLRRAVRRASWALLGALRSLSGALAATFCRFLACDGLLDGLLVDFRSILGASRGVRTLDFARPYGTLVTFSENRCFPFAALLGSSLGTLLGVSWPVLGALGALLGTLGRSLRAPATLPGRSWPHLCASAWSLGAPGCSLAALGRFRCGLGTLLGRTSVESLGEDLDQLPCA